MEETTKVSVKEDVLNELLKRVERPEDLLGPDGLLHQLKGALMQRMLEAEMTDHLGFEANAAEGRGAGNTRNGYSAKTVQTETGPVELRMPRDRKGSFEPKLIPKHSRRLEGFNEKVLALYSRGMSTRDIEGHLRELYGTDVSPDLISRVTDAVVDEAREWQGRGLEAFYPILYLDALFVSIREGGIVTKRAVYVAMGVDLEGTREVLGFWVGAGEGEGARYWLGVMTELKNRGLQDVLFVCCDGLTGLPQAVEAAFPKAVVQTCIVHMIRASLRYVGYDVRKQLVDALKPVYAALNEQAARDALDAFEKVWGKKFPAIPKLWRSRWNEVVPFLAYPPAIRRMLYTTNVIESLNSQLRKVLKPKGAFPNESAVTKLLYLALRRAKLSWKRPHGWPEALRHFQIVFGDRLPA